MAFFQRPEGLRQYQLKRLSHTFPIQRRAERYRYAGWAPSAFDFILADNLLQISFVELDNEGQIIEIQTYPTGVFLKIIETLEVAHCLTHLRVGNENDTVSP